MKIALVSPYDFTWPGGVTVHISQLAHQFTNMGHQVQILAPIPPHGSRKTVGLCPWEGQCPYPPAVPSQGCLSPCGCTAR